MRTSLYRHFNAEGRLLYVGVSLSAVARLGQHKGSEWFDSIATVTIEYFATREDALLAEREAIRCERPLHNKKLREFRVIEPQLRCEYGPNLPHNRDPWFIRRREGYVEYFTDDGSMVRASISVPWQYLVDTVERI